MVFAGAVVFAANAAGASATPRHKAELDNASAIRDCLLMSKNSQNDSPEAHASGGQSGTNYLTLSIRTLAERLVLSG